MHEWGHELRYKFWNDPVKDLFHDAVQIETHWNPRQYAARGDSEQWAVLGEELLGTAQMTLSRHATMHRFAPQYGWWL